MIIDFETIPEGTPSEGLAISGQFQETHGMSFRLSNGADPVLAQVGPPRVAFQGYDIGHRDDSPAPGQGVGQFFLTDDLTLGYGGFPIIIDLSTPAQRVSGVLLDIDQPGETWTIEGLASDEAVLAVTVVTSGDPFTGDGRATPWAVQDNSSGIHSVRLSYTGTYPTSLAGFAIDNLSAEPLTAVEDWEVYR